jgi:hypothetical protein
MVSAIYRIVGPSPAPHPSGTQQVTKDILDAGGEILMQVIVHALKVPAGQDEHLAGVALQPL